MVSRYFFNLHNAEIAQVELTILVLDKYIIYVKIMLVT